MKPRTRKPSHARREGTSAAKDLFADAVEYTNLTQFRESVLRFANALESDPWTKYLVTKHGKPLAVFLSFDAFEAFRKVAQEVLASDSGKSSSQVLEEARARMDSENQPLPADYESRSALVKQIGALREELSRIESRVSDLAQAGAAREVSRSR